MLCLHLRRAIAAVVACAALAAFTTLPVTAETDVSLDPASATSPILVRGDALPGDGNATPHTMDAGMSFENRAGAAATSVDFTWLFIDANGDAIGEEHTSTRGHFAPYVPVARNAAEQVRFPGYASGDSLYIDDADTNIFEPVEQILIAVDNATFADGSEWHGKTRQTSAPPTQVMYDPSAQAAHIRIVRIQSTKADSLYDRFDTLLTFTNDNTKRIDAIQFEYRFYDYDGDVIEQQTAVVRGVYPHGAISTLNPQTRVTNRGVVVNGSSVWLGWGSDAQYVAKIAAGVTAIRYTDGTTWRSST